MCFTKNLAAVGILLNLSVMAQGSGQASPKSRHEVLPCHKDASEERQTCATSGSTSATLLLSALAALRQIQHPDGLWEQSGYGTILEFKHNLVATYDVTTRGCYQASELPFDQFVEQYGPLRSLTFQGGTMTLVSPTTTYTFRRISAFPAPLIAPATSLSPTEEYNLFWQTFQENYAFFHERAINWKATGERMRAALTRGEKTFWQCVEESLQPLKDGHVSARLGSNMVTSGEANAQAGRTEKQMRRELLSTLTGDTLFRGRFIQVCNNRVGYATLPSGTAYLVVFSMGGFLPGEASLTQEHAALAQGLEEAFDSFGNPQGVILDLRSNSGGYDSVSLDLIGRFLTKSRAVMKKRYYFRGKKSPWQPLWVPPCAKPFAGRVIVLTSKNTISAGESCALGLKALPNITLVGQYTQGTLSDALEKHLPGGMMFTLSNEIYANLAGKCPEVQGVRPDVITSSSGPLTRDILLADQMLATTGTK